MNTETSTVSLPTMLEMAKELGPTLTQYVEEEERDRRPAKQVLDELRQAGFLRLFTPMSLGGMEADPVTTAGIVEEIAFHNTTAAWSMMVSNTSSWWCGRLSDQGIDALYAGGPDTTIAGAFHPPMKATPVDDGYLINGRSPLASNVHQARWIFVTAFVMNGGEIKTNNGVPEIIGVFMKADDCQIIDTWQALGMRATDSNDVSAANVFVPSHLSYALVPDYKPNRHYEGMLYRFPAIGASIASLIAPIALAVARNAINALKSIAAKKVPFGSTVSIRERGSVQRKLGLAEAHVQCSRTWLYQVIADAWKKTIGGEKLTLEERAKILLAATHTNQTCQQAVDLMYSAAGTSGVYTTNKLARYFCDAQVIRHHGFANESRYETAAQVYFGLPPDLPVLLF